MRRFVLLDRDGTINVDRQYLSDPADLELLPNAAAGLRQFRSMGLGMIVVTNQSAINRGYFDTSRLEAIHQRLFSMLRDEGVELDGIYFCPHTPDDECNCRKPQPGLALRAASDHSFDPALSFVVGDKPSDIELGKTIGARTLLVHTGYGAESGRHPSTKPDFVVADLLEAAEVIGQQL